MNRLVVSTFVVLGALEGSALAETPPAPVVRQVPPGMETLARAQETARAPKPPGHWRGGFTLRVSLGAGTLIASDDDGSASDSSTTFALSLGAFLSSRLALYGHFEGAGGGGDMTTRGLQLYGLGADVFVSDRIVVAAGFGQAVTDAWDGDWYDELRGPGVQARAGYVVWQRRKHALDLTGAVTAAWFDDRQVTTAGVHLGYRFF